MTLSELRGALRSRRLSQFDLARQVGLSQPYVSQVMRGDVIPRPEIKERFERAIVELGLNEPLVPETNPEVVFELPVLDRAS
jgi:transcriptional regulator with XRE-family HTH domain